MSTEDSLSKKNKKDLVALILSLQEENTELRRYSEFVTEVAKRMESLERRQNLSEQYNRRENIEISGINVNVKHEDLEKTVIKIFKAAEVNVDGKELSNSDISACHRIGKKGKTIVRLVNRKYASAILFRGKTLRGKDGFSETYVNNSFSKEMGWINWQVRLAHKEEEKEFIEYRVRNGITQIKQKKDGEFIPLTHRNDLASVGITIDES